MAVLNKIVNTGEQGLPIEGLLAAPFLAATHANAQMAKEQAQFLIDFCFSKDGDVYHPVMVKLSLTKYVMEPSTQKDAEPTFKKAFMHFEVPLLSIIPINSLSVQDVEVDFELEITSQISDEELHDDKNETNSSTSNKGKLIKLKGNVSHDSKESQSNSARTTYKKQNNAKISVNMKAGSLPLPVGVTTLINLYAKNINSQHMGATSNDEK